MDSGETVDGVATGLRRAVTRLYSRFRSERMEGEVPDAALFVLIMLGKAGRMTLTELAAAAHVALGSMSQTARRLGELGYVTKERGVEDRRQSLYSLTAAGTAAMTAAQQHRRDWLAGQVAGLSAEERAAIARITPVLLRIAES